LTDQEIAKIIFDREKKQILNIITLREDLRFRCKRCAVFCCKLGGPLVREADLKRIARAGFDPYEFIEPIRHRHNQQRDVIAVLKQKDDGSCIFLKYNETMDLYECRIYEDRPSLCRLYPFEFILENDETGILRIIPCCNGLNTPNGEIVNREFIEKYLLDAIREIFWEA